MHAHIVVATCNECGRCWDSNTNNLQEHEEYDVCRECFHSQTEPTPTTKEDNLALVQLNS